MSKVKTKEVEDEKKEDEKKETEEETTEEGDTKEGNVEEEAKELSDQISAQLNLKDLRSKVDKIIENSKEAKKIFTAGDVKKEKSELTGDEKIVAFFQALTRAGGPDHAVLKALSEGTAADGGYLFPDEFRAELIRDLEEPTRMRALVRVVPMKRDVLKVPKLGSKPKVTWTAENAAKSTTTADFEEKTLTAHKVAAILYASEELVEDSREIDVVKLIIGLFGEAIAEEEDRVITVGSGTAQPTGLNACSISSVTCSGNLDFDDIIDLIYALPAKYRSSAKFLVHNTNIKEMRKFKDSQNRYLWQDAVAPGQPATFHGYSVIENNHLPESVIYFGDYKRGYWLGDRKRMSVTVSNIAGNAWEYDQIGIRVVSRIGGNCVLEAAMRKLITIP